VEDHFPISELCLPSNVAVLSLIVAQLVGIDVLEEIIIQNELFFDVRRQDVFILDLFHTKGEGPWSLGVVVKANVSCLTHIAPVFCLQQKGELPFLFCLGRLESQETLFHVLLLKLHFLNVNLSIIGLIKFLVFFNQILVGILDLSEIG